MAAACAGRLGDWQHKQNDQEIGGNEQYRDPYPEASAWAVKALAICSEFEMCLLFLNVHCLQRKLLGWKGRIFQNMTVIAICSWWKASLLMGGYPAWFLCVAHPLPVPVSNRKGLTQRREEHWLPGNCNTKWRNSRKVLCYKRAPLSDLSCSGVWVTAQNPVLLGGVFSSFLVVVIC